MRSTYALINLSDLKKNYLNIRKRVNKNIMAVVKANAYGHSVGESVNALLSLGQNKPEYFAVAFSDEGIELRKHNVKQPILVFEPFNKSEAANLIKYNLIGTVFTEKHLHILLNVRRELSSNNKIKIHVKVDTGMNRFGIRFDKAFDFIKKLSLNKNFVIDGVYTHFATSDKRNKDFAEIQLHRFNDLISKLKKNGVNYGLAHAANSGAILDMPDSYFDMVRPGILLYGYYPSLETSESINIKPVMSLFSKVASV